MFNLLVLSLLSSSVLPVVLVSHFIAVCRSSFIRCHVWLLQPHKPLLVKRRLGSQRGRETLKDKDKTLSLSPFAFLIVAAYRFFILPWRPPFCHRATIPLSSSQSPANTMTTGWNVSCYLHRPQYSVCVCVCALTTVCFVTPVITVVVAVAHQFLRDANPSRTQVMIFPATYGCQPIRERVQQWCTTTIFITYKKLQSL